MIKCLTLHQPWATLVAIGAKRIETRSWSTSYRGPLAIAASKAYPTKYRLLTLEAPFSGALYIGWQFQGEGQPYRPLPLGSILCVCDLVDCTEIGVIGDYTPEPERSFGDYTPGRFAWHLANVRALPEPIKAKGMLGLWTPEAPVLERLERFYKEAA